MASWKAPTPGSTSLSASAMRSASPRDLGRVADPLERLLHAAKVGHAVIENRNLGVGHESLSGIGLNKERNQPDA